MKKAPKFYTKDYLLRAGMSFAIDVVDPVERIQEFMNSYKREPVAEVPLRCSKRSSSAERLTILRASKSL